MRSLIIVLMKPAVQILLERLYTFIELRAEHNPEKLIQDRTVKALHKAVCLGSADLGPAVFDVVQCQIQLIGMGLRAAVLPSVVRENRLYYYVPLFLQTMYNG